MNQLIDEKKYKHQLIDEGFSNIYTIYDGPYGVYSKHSHKVFSARVILAGEIEVDIGGELKKYIAGDRFDLLPLVEHSSKMGPEGCTYIVAEK